MKRADMTCLKCIKYEAPACRLNPPAVSINDPEGHWCSQGMWHQWSERYREMEPFYWGEWEDDR